MASSSSEISEGLPTIRPTAVPTEIVDLSSDRAGRIVFGVS
jgi:hypothetical protein